MQTHLRCVSQINFGGVHPSVISFWKGASFWKIMEHVSVGIPERWLPPESVASNHGDIPKPIKGPVTNILGLPLHK